MKIMSKLEKLKSILDDSNIDYKETYFEDYENRKMLSFLIIEKDDKTFVVYYSHKTKKFGFSCSDIDDSYFIGKHNMDAVLEQIIKFYK